MTTITGTGNAVSAAKTAAAVMVLALFASVAGFVVPIGPAAAQGTCVTTTVEVNGVPLSVTHCYEDTPPTYLDVVPPANHVWCSATFGHFFQGAIENDPDRIAFHRQWLAIGVLAGVEYVPKDADGTGCVKRLVPASNTCIVHQSGRWRFDGDGNFRVFDASQPRWAPDPWRPPNCLTEDYTVSAEAVRAEAKAAVCEGVIEAPRYVEYYPDQRLSTAPFTWAPGEIGYLDLSDVDFDDCCPRWDEHEHDTPHSDGAPNNGCHKHTRPRCQAEQAVTYDRIDGDSHSTGTVAPCPDTAVGATFDIVLDYPRRGHGRFATIGGALAPVTFTGTARNFNCNGSCLGDPAAGSPHPVAVSFGLDLAGLNGYTEGHGNNFREISKTVTGNGRVLNLSINIVAEFYRATLTVPDQRVAINIVNPTGTYQYYEFVYVDYWIPVPDHPDGGVWYPVKEVRARQASMAARIVDVDGDPITADPYYRNGRVELRIAGFQPVID